MKLTTGFSKSELWDSAARQSEDLAGPGFDPRFDFVHNQTLILLCCPWRKKRWRKKCSNIFILLLLLFFEREENNQDFWDWASVTKIYGCWPCVKILANCVKICDKFASNWERERRLCFGEKWERISNWKLSFKNMFVLFFYLLNEEEIRIKNWTRFKKKLAVVQIEVLGCSAMQPGRSNVVRKTDDSSPWTCSCSSPLRWY